MLPSQLQLRSATSEILLIAINPSGAAKFNNETASQSQSIESGSKTFR